METELLVVCGLHRSGTTFVGELLRQAGVCVIHEPLNRRFGVVDVPVAYPFIGPEGGEHASLLDDIRVFKKGWTRDSRYASGRGVKGLVHRMTGGRNGMRWDMLRMRSAFGGLPKQICWKDPFATLATPYLVKRLGARVVCMVRHPAAIHCSTEKQGWGYDIGNLRIQEELIAEHCAGIADEHWNLAEKHHAASIAVLWKIMMRVNLSLDSENLLVLKHEALCLEPVATAQRIVDHLHAPYTPGLEAFVIEHSEGGKADGREGKVHDFRRNSRELVNSWRNKISADDEKMMRTIVGEEVGDLYGNW